MSGRLHHQPRPLHHTRHLFSDRGTKLKCPGTNYNALVLNVLKQGVLEDAAQLVSGRLHHQPHPLHHTRYQVDFI